MKNKRNFEEIVGFVRYRFLNKNVEVNNYIKKIMLDVFGIETEMAQIEVCSLFVEDFIENVQEFLKGVDVNLDYEIYNAYLKAVEYMDENYYALIDYVVGTEPYLSDSLEMDIKDIHSTKVIKYGERWDYSCCDILDISQNKEELEGMY